MKCHNCESICVCLIQCPFNRGFNVFSPLHSMGPRKMSVKWRCLRNRVSVTGSFTVLKCIQKRQCRFTLKLNTAKNMHYVKSFLNKSCSELNFVQKSQWAHMSVFLSSGARELPKIAVFKLLKCTKMAKYIHFEAKRCHKYPLCQKCLQIKIVQN